MDTHKNTVGFILRFVGVIAALTALADRTSAQDIGITTSTMHDENIFDTYSPVSDQITQAQLDLSKDWDFDVLSLSAGYTGSMIWFRDLTARNYHVHVLSVNGLYQLDSHDEIDEENDSSGPELVKPQFPLDSLNRTLAGTLSVSSQFDRQEFQQYDYTLVSANVVFRQPLGMQASVRPSYTFSYHRYPNIAGLTNIKNVFAAHLRASPIAGGWIALTPTYAIKSYPISSSFDVQYTVDTTIVDHSHGSGKPIITKGKTERHKIVLLNSPTVEQFSLSVSLEQRISSATQLRSVYVHSFVPPAEARVIPELRGQAFQQQDIVSEINTQNEIFDDPFSYSGNEVGIRVEQLLPFSLGLGVSGQFESKIYTYPARDSLTDDALASNREDKRTTIEIDLARPITLGAGKVLKPQVEYHYLRNNSNAPYYDFAKSTYTVSIELNF